MSVQKAPSLCVAEYSKQFIFQREEWGAILWSNLDRRLTVESREDPEHLAEADKRVEQRSLKVVVMGGRGIRY